METYTDLTLYTNNGYKLAELIESEKYNNIFYYEFHEEVDPTGIYNCLSGLEEFQNRSREYYKIFFSYGYADEFPAVIHIALKISGEWFIAKDVGSNFYAGYGPMGIIKLRQACSKFNIAAFALDDNFDDWIKKKFGKTRKSLPYEKKNSDAIQFEKLCKALQFLTVDMQRRPEQFQGLTEENIRDRMLIPLNVVFKGRGHAESKNVKGKTDILIRTKDGLNEHIFELKVWRGMETLQNTIEQLGNYLSFHNNHCGIIMFCYNKNFKAILSAVDKYLKEAYNYDKNEQLVENEFRFKLSDKKHLEKNTQLHLILINLF